MRHVLSSRLVLGAASALGAGARLALTALDRGGLSVIGAGLVACGLAMAWPPLGVIALGVAALAMDRGRTR